MMLNCSQSSEKLSELQLTISQLEAKLKDANQYFEENSSLENWQDRTKIYEDLNKKKCELLKEHLNQKSRED